MTKKEEYVTYKYDDVTKAFLTDTERDSRHQQLREWIEFTDELGKFGESQ
jgi:hypothetical protein